MIKQNPFNYFKTSPEIMSGYVRLKQELHETLDRQEPAQGMECNSRPSSGDCKELIVVSNVVLVV